MKFNKNSLKPWMFPYSYSYDIHSLEFYDKNIRILNIIKIYKTSCVEFLNICEEHHILNSSTYEIKSLKSLTGNRVWKKKHEKLQEKLHEKINTKSYMKQYISIHIPTISDRKIHTLSILNIVWEKISVFRKKCSQFSTKLKKFRAGKITKFTY